MKRYSEILSTSNDYQNDLYSLLRGDFAFLESEYRMVRAELGDGYRYENATTVVYVRLWEEPWVGVDRCSNPFGQADFGLPIWGIMNVKDSKYLYNDANASIDKFPVYSRALGECCADMLSGDFSDASRVIEFLEHRQAKSQMWGSRLHEDGAK